MSGWVKLHRSVTDSFVFQNPDRLKFWIWCLCKASHKERTQNIGLQEIVLNPGQFVFGRKKASSELNMEESKVYRLIKTFEKRDKIEVKSNNKFSVVTIVNWTFYQDCEQQSEQQSNNKLTTNQQQSNTNKNVKNDKNVNNKDKESKSKRFTPPSYNDVLLYCSQRSNSVDPQTFIDFYSSKGWMVGKNKMKDWKACVRTWEKRDNTSNNKPTKKPNSFHGYDQRPKMTNDELERKLGVKKG